MVGHGSRSLAVTSNCPQTLRRSCGSKYVYSWLLAVKDCTRHHAAARHYLPLLIDSYPFIGATHNNTQLALAISRPFMTYRNKKLR
jgi:hypothetical protein